MKAKKNKKKEKKVVCTCEDTMPVHDSYYMLLVGVNYARQGHSLLNDNLLVFSSYDKAEEVRATVVSKFPHTKTVEVTFDTLFALLTPGSPKCVVDGIHVTLGMDTEPN